MSWRTRCTCEPPPRGPPWDDGSDPGMCAFCEYEREEAPIVALLEEHLDGDPPTLEELDDETLDCRWEMMSTS